jgi:phosphatidate cytidylyltransferase
MKTRIISGAAALALLAVVMLSGSVALGVAVFGLALLGIYEFYNAARSGGYNPVYVLGYIACLPLLYPALTGRSLYTLPGSIQLNLLESISLLIFLLIVLVFCLMIFSKGKYNLVDISVTLFGILYVPFLLSFVTLTRNLEDGYLYIWLIFMGGWVTDTFAYFTGVTLGRTKILPKVSPKKSLEGSIGGVIGCTAAMAAFGALAGESLGGVPVYHFAVLGLLCGIISQVGDWAASAIKRFVNIKDYGKVMPGHGGVLDRIDSILFVAPAVYFYISLFMGQA